MKLLDLNTIKAYPYEERGKNVFFRTSEFKTRIIELPIGGERPTCEREAYVVFIVIQGSAKVTVNQEKIPLAASQCLITEPAPLSIKTGKDTTILGLQVTTSKNYL